MPEKWYPTEEQFREISRFLRRYEFTPDQAVGGWRATEKGFAHISFRAQVNRDGIREVLEVDGETTEKNLSDRDFRVLSMDDFAWKLFCLLKKRGKV